MFFCTYISPDFPFHHSWPSFIYYINTHGSLMCSVLSHIQNYVMPCNLHTVRPSSMWLSVVSCASVTSFLFGFPLLSGGTPRHWSVCNTIGTVITLNALMKTVVECVCGGAGGRRWGGGAIAVDFHSRPIVWYQRCHHWTSNPLLVSLDNVILWQKYIDLLILNILK